MNVRTLPPAEYGRLREINDGYVPDPAQGMVAVAESGGRIVGRIFLIAPAHVEGPWIEPSQRGGAVLGRLVEYVEATAKAAGLSKLFAFGANEQMEDYIQRLGYKRQPYTVWVKELV